jgi:uncharacterized membrane protein
VTRSVRLLLLGHVVVLLFCIGGLLIALPNPTLWSGSPLGPFIFQIGSSYAGPVYILLGAATLAVYGIESYGWRRTGIFFAAAVGVSLTSELIGTSTGWPFGAYSYTAGLGPKILGRVPATIPLSWFYMGFAAYLVATQTLASWHGRPAGLMSALLGAWLLLGWDLVLDPSMARDGLPIQFWVWHQGGFYLGMPLRNLLGWFVTALIYMTVSQVVWRGSLVGRGSTPVVVYVANLGFAAILSAQGHLWIPLALSVSILAVTGLALWLISPRAKERSLLEPFRSPGVSR